MTKIRIWIIGTAFILLAGIAGYAWFTTLNTPRSAYASDTDPNVHIGGPFTLTDQNGKPVTQSLLDGKWTAVFFGYTYCPDTCPLTLQSLARTKTAMGDKGKDLQIVFITVDPARDTPAALKSYLASGGFPPGVVGLTGSQDQVSAVEKGYAVTAEKQPDTSGGYSFNHTSIVYLMNPKGQFVAPLTEDLPPEKSANMIKDMMRGA